MESFCFRPPPSLLAGISSPPIATSTSAHFNASSLPAAGSTFWPRRGQKGNNNDEISVEEAREEKAALVEEEQESPRGGQRGNWVFKILRVKEIWGEGGGGFDGVLERRGDGGSGDRILGEGGDRILDEGCSVGGDEDAEFDRDSFSRLLRRVSLAEARLYAQLSYLGNLAYTIPRINPMNLLKGHGLRFVTSSLEMKLQPSNANQEMLNTQEQETEVNEKVKEETDGERQRKNGYHIDTSAAYQIAVSAASYLQSQTKSILPFKSADAVILTGAASLEEGSKNEEADITNSEMASFVATTDSVTAMVAAKEETKQALAKDLNSAQSSPCEWFICDDDRSHTRVFVIQGSESLASWQANLLFEPIQFEGLDVLVHRGIYEAAKGIYEQMLPEVQAHLRYHRKSAALRFTGHSLGGSLALLVNLMLLIRGEAPPSSLLPVITFGSPSIMCGGNYLLRMLGLPQSHLQAIMMHRDIVPRAFSCNYPDHVAEILKAVNGKFRNHPCLEQQKILYAPMGELLILQPDEKLSPHHHLLPSGSGMYMFGHPLRNSNDSEQLAQAALSVFLNSPHPLETLSDRSSYGSEGTINRDHDMNSYVRALRGIIRQELKRIRKAKREHRRQAWWPIVAQQGIHGSNIMGGQGGSKDFGSGQFSFSGVFQGRREPLKRFGRMVASGHLHLLVMLLLPARLLFPGSITDGFS